MPSSTSVYMSLVAVTLLLYTITRTLKYVRVIVYTNNERLQQKTKNTILLISGINHLN